MLVFFFALFIPLSNSSSIGTAEGQLIISTLAALPNGISSCSSNDYVVNLISAAVPVTTLDASVAVGVLHSIQNDIHVNRIRVITPTGISMTYFKPTSSAEAAPRQKSTTYGDKSGIFAFLILHHSDTVIVFTVSLALLTIIMIKRRRFTSILPSQAPASFFLTLLFLMAARTYAQTTLLASWDLSTDLLPTGSGINVGISDAATCAPTVVAATLCNSADIISYCGVGTPSTNDFCLASKTWGATTYGQNWIQFCTSTTGFSAISIDIEILNSNNLASLTTAGGESARWVVATSSSAVFSTLNNVPIGPVPSDSSWHAFTTALPTLADDQSTLCARFYDATAESSDALTISLSSVSIFYDHTATPSALTSVTRSTSTSPSVTRSRSTSSSTSVSAANTKTRTLSPSISASSTDSRTRSTSQTSSGCSSVTRTRSTSQTSSSCSSVTRSHSGTTSTTGSSSLTPSYSPSETTSGSFSPSSSESFSAILSSTNSNSPSSSACSSVTKSQTFSPTTSRSSSATNSISSCPSATSSPSRSSSGTVTNTRTRSSSHSVSVTASHTVSSSASTSPSDTHSVSVTVSGSHSSSPSYTVSASATATHTARARAVWPMFRRSETHAADSGIWAINEAGIYLMWKVSAPGSVRSSPALGLGGVVFIGANSRPSAQGTGGVLAILADGTVLWTVRTPSYVTSSPALVDVAIRPLVVVGSLDGTFFALDANSGSTVWNVSLGSTAAIASSPVLSPISWGTWGGGGGGGQAVFVGDESGGFSAFVVNTGVLLWKRVLPGAVSSSPALDGPRSLIFVGCSDGYLYALEANNGLTRWSALTLGAIVSSPSLDGSGRLYVGSLDSHFYSLNASSGAQLWNTSVGGGVGSSPALCTNGTETSLAIREVAVVTPLDRATPSTLVFFGARDGAVYALNASNGFIRWKVQTGGLVESSPALGGDCTCYIGSHDGRVRALNATTGAQLWVYDTGSIVESSPAIASDGTIIFGTWGLNGGSIGASVIALRNKGPTPSAQPSATLAASFSAYPSPQGPPTISSQMSDSPSASPSSSPSRHRPTSTPLLFNTFSSTGTIEATVSASTSETARSRSAVASSIASSTSSPTATAASVGATGTATATRTARSNNVNTNPSAPWPCRSGSSARTGLVPISTRMPRVFNVLSDTPIVIWRLQIGLPLLGGCSIDEYGTSFFSADVAANQRRVANDGLLSNVVAGGALIGVDVITGSLNWYIPTSVGVRGTPVRAAVADRLYAGTGEFLTAFNLGSRGGGYPGVNWTYAPLPSGPAILTSPPRYADAAPLTLPPFYDSDIIVTSSSSAWSNDQHLARVTTSGVPVWTSSANGSGVTSSPALGGGNALIYVGADNGFAYAFAVTTGAMVWSVNLRGGPIYASPVVAQCGGSSSSSSVVGNGVLFALGGGTVSGTLYCLNAMTGGQLWNTTAPNDAGSPSVFRPLTPVPAASAAQGSGILIWSWGTAVMGVSSSNGLLIWTLRFFFAQTGGPTLSNDGLSVWIGDTVGVLRSIDTVKGIILSTLELDGGIHGSPAIAENGWVIVGTLNGVVYGIGGVATVTPSAQATITNLATRFSTFSSAVTLQMSPSPFPTLAGSMTARITSCPTQSSTTSAIFSASAIGTATSILTTSEVSSLSLSLAATTSISSTAVSTATATKSVSMNPTVMYRKFRNGAVREAATPWFALCFALGAAALLATVL